MHTDADDTHSAQYREPTRHLCDGVGLTELCPICVLRRCCRRIESNMFRRDNQCEHGDLNYVLDTHGKGDEGRKTGNVGKRVRQIKLGEKGCLSLLIYRGTGRSRVSSLTNSKSRPLVRDVA